MTLPKVQDVLFEHLSSLQEIHESDGTICSRASSAGKCARAIGFQISGLPATNPPAGDSLLNFSIGDHIHDLVQTAMLAKYPDAEKELEGSIGDYLTGHCDLRYSAEDGLKVVCEIKSIADFAFMKATGIALKSSGRWHKKEELPEGPKREHKLQAGIYALMLDAPYMAIVYVRKTATKDEPVTWEWRYHFSESGYVDEVVKELNRHKTIVEMVRDNRMPEREFEGRIIENPKTERWPCGYCSYIDACTALGPGEVQIK